MPKIDHVDGIAPFSWHTLVDTRFVDHKGRLFAMPLLLYTIAESTTTSIEYICTWKITLLHSADSDVIDFPGL